MVITAVRLATAALVARYTLAPVGACICLFETSAKPAKQVSKSILCEKKPCGGEPYGFFRLESSVGIISVRSH